MGSTTAAVQISKVWFVARPKSLVTSPDKAFVDIFGGGPGGGFISRDSTKTSFWWQLMVRHDLLAEYASSAVGCQHEVVDLSMASFGVAAIQ